MVIGAPEGLCGRCGAKGEQGDGFIGLSLVEVLPGSLHSGPQKARAPVGMTGLGKAKTAAPRLADPKIGHYMILGKGMGCVGAGLVSSAGVSFCGLRLGTEG